MSRIDPQQPGHRGAPVPGGRAWRSLTCEEGASRPKGRCGRLCATECADVAGKARCMSEDAPELTAELVVDGVVPSQPAVSPDGCWVAYVVAPQAAGESVECARSGWPLLTAAHRRGS